MSAEPSSGFSAVYWLCSVAAHGCLLFGIAPRAKTGLLLRRAGIAIVAAPVCLIAVALLIKASGIRPSGSLGDRIFSFFVTAEILALLTVANVIFHGMVDAIVSFHERANTANLQRFPISFLIRFRRGLKTFGTSAWFAGGSLMLYGVWFDTHI